MSEEVKPFTQLEFFEYEKANGMTPDNESYKNLHYRLAEKVLQDLNPQSITEIGCGSGACLEYLIKKGIDAIGVDYNEYHKKYFESRNPEKYYRYVLHDLKNTLPDREVDVIISIECFEHLEDKVLAKAVDYVSRNCKYFVFSSTPHPDPEFDIQWGHVNVKPTEEWIRLFEKKGMKLFRKWSVPTSWTLVFENDL